MRQTGHSQGFVKLSRNNNHIYVSYRKERAKFEEEYASNEEGVFIFDVQDPLDESWKYRDTNRAYGTLRRLKNHSPKPNLRPKVSRIYGDLVLGFLSLQPIKAGQQLFYNYGAQPHPPPWLRRRL